MARRLLPEIVDHVKRFEGCRLTAYPDPGSKNGEPWTIGYGHTSDKFMAVRRGMTISQAQADAALEHDLGEAADIVDRLVKVPLNDWQRGALASFVLNIGEGQFSGSTLLRKLNAGNYDAVPGELARWNKNDGKVMKGLVNRRAAEAGLWVRTSFVASNTVPAAPGNPVRELLTPERITAAGGLLGGAASLASGNGPVQIAVAVCLVAAAVVIGFLVVRKATR
ncbi:lysozyme [Ancylobacter oerskovii]|uniref:Lysozyme n=1 Tax=Ancylobacter oerskovii TaxID=459519 RepID=A0ABW4YR53_9HYPH|nr:lysozyme [Ancylobacter oerskovii]MBS7545696.1 lysozyme [Ancylobacter oerskovii]